MYYTYVCIYVCVYIYIQYISLIKDLKTFIWFFLFMSTYGLFKRLPTERKNINSTARLTPCFVANCLNFRKPSVGSKRTPAPLRRLVAAVQSPGSTETLCGACSSVHSCPHYNTAWGLELNIFLEHNELCTVLKVFEMDLTVIQYKKSQIKGPGKSTDTQAPTDKGHCVVVKRQVERCGGLS